MYDLVRQQTVRASRDEVFGFFADAANLEALTPPELGFQILTPAPIDMHRGTRIDYRIKLHGVPMKWKTLIEAYEPGVRFVDTQLKGPYKLWHHTHTFVDAEGGGTELGDHVRYEMPFGPLGTIAHVVVKRQLKRIFDFREQVIRERFG